MNDTQLLERLSSAYATVEAPAPSAALAALLDTGGVADDDRTDAVVLPFAPPVRSTARGTLRVRHLVAAMVATFVLFSGLAVAGALPDAIQRQVSSVVGHLGIDLPSPTTPSGGGSDAPRDQEHPQTTSTAPGGVTSGSGRGADTPADGTTPSSTPSSATTVAPAGTDTGGLGTGDGGASGGSVGPTTTLLPGGSSLLPPISLPPISLPPIDLPGLPPITVPQITLPPITLPFGL